MKSGPILNFGIVSRAVTVAQKWWISGFLTSNTCAPTIYWFLYRFAKTQQTKTLLEQMEQGVFMHLPNRTAERGAAVWNTFFLMQRAMINWWILHLVHSAAEIQSAALFHCSPGAGANYPALGWGIPGIQRENGMWRREEGEWVHYF